MCTHVHPVITCMSGPLGSTPLIGAEYSAPGLIPAGVVHYYVPSMCAVGLRGLDVRMIPVPRPISSAILLGSEWKPSSSRKGKGMAAS